MSPDVADTTLRELLTMTAGFAGLDRDRTAEYMADPDPVGRILQAAPDPLGGGFEFSNQGAHVVAAVLAEATGMSVLDYARSRLFEPLGIDTRPAFELPLDAGNMDDVHRCRLRVAGRRVGPAPGLGRAQAPPC